MSNSTCLRANLENSNIGAANKSQAPSKKKPNGRLNEVAYSQPKSNTKASPFPSLRVHSKHEGANMKCKTQLRAGRDIKQNQTGEQLWRTHWQILASRSGSILAGCGIHWRAALAGYSAGSTGEQLWRDTGRDPLAWRDPLATRSGGILGGIHWRAALAGYSAGSTGDPLWRDTRRSGGILGGIHWRAALAGYPAGSTGELLWRDTGWGHGVEASQTRIPT